MRISDFFEVCQCHIILVTKVYRYFFSFQNEFHERIENFQSKISKNKKNQSVEKSKQESNAIFSNSIIIVDIITLIMML